jgi:16S rRNA processing protein RimM
MYLIGNITNSHGIRGEVKIYNYSDFNRFFIGATLIVMIKGVKKTFEIERVRPQGNLFIVKFKGYDNINDILPFKGLDVFSESDVEDQLEADDFHYQDLVDKQVFDTEGNLLGHVISMIPVPQGHLLEILKTDGKKAMIPFVEAFVTSVDKDRIIISTIEGLL